MSSLIQGQRAFLLTWNPLRWEWSTLEADLVAVATGQAPVAMNWSTGNTRSITTGDRVFLLKLGVDPKGIMGSGYVEAPPTEGPHWDAAKRAAGQTGWSVRVRFDRLCHPDDVLGVDRLREGPLADVHWSPYASGSQVPPHLVGALEDAWSAFAPSHGAHALPEELVPGATYVEGGIRTVLVNRYERDPKARAACIEAWGSDCTVCGFSFEKRYGAHGEGYIQVHHLTPLAEQANERFVDPVRDLRPVCANCHAMLHRGPRLLTPEELRTYIRG